MIGPYLSQTVTLDRRTGSSSYGESTYSAAASLSARVQQKTKLIRTAQGMEVLSDAQVYLESGTAILPGDRLTYDGTAYQVLSVQRSRGLDAETHVVAFLGR